MGQVVSQPRRTLSYLLKLVVFFSALIGTALSAYGGRTAFMGGSSVFMYFTIQSNIAIAVICAVGGVLMHRRSKVGTVWFVIKFVGTVAITLTGLVFCFILAPTMGKFAWNVQNILTHVAVPLAAVIDFFVTAVYGSLKKKHVPYILIPPLLYVVYAGIGYAAGWQFAPGINYPYFFLNWGSPAGAFGFSGQLPFMGCVWWILSLLLLLLVVGFVYLAAVNAMKRRICSKNTKRAAI